MLMAVRVQNDFFGFKLHVSGWSYRPLFLSVLRSDPFLVLADTAMHPVGTDSVSGTFGTRSMPPGRAPAQYSNVVPNFTT